MSYRGINVAGDSGDAWNNIRQVARFFNGPKRFKRWSRSETKLGRP